MKQKYTQNLICPLVSDKEPSHFCRSRHETLSACPLITCTVRLGYSGIIIAVFVSMEMKVVKYLKEFESEVDITALQIAL